VPERGVFGGDTTGTSLVDLLDRVLQRGVYVSGDVTICLAGIDLARLDLRLLLTGIEVGPVLETRPTRVIRPRPEGGVPA
jgi:hypothetical protein